MNLELPDVQAGFQRGRGIRDQIANICWIMEKAREFQKNISCFIDYTKAFDCVDHDKLWKILQEMGVPDHLTCLLRNLYADQEATSSVGLYAIQEPDMEQWTGSKLGKEEDKTVYCHPVSLTYMQSTSCEMLGWMKHKLESRLLEKYQQPQICRWYNTNGRKWRGTRASWWRWKRRVKKLLKTQHSNN